MSKPNSADNNSIDIAPGPSNPQSQSEVPLSDPLSTTPLANVRQTTPIVDDKLIAIKKKIFNCT